MIELLLVADQLLAAGELDRAERIYTQIADADPRNAIAVVGMARVAEARGDDDRVRELAERALAIDPEDQAARRLAAAPGVAPEPAAPKPTAAEMVRVPRRSIIARIRTLLGLGG
jgi:tetratricopeptide (TPR) repeat protein